MIIARLSDGMGNQMFQYAVGRALSIRRAVPLRLDISAYARDPKRRYALDVFPIRAALVSGEDIAHVAPQPVDRARAWWDQSAAMEPHFHYTPDLWRVPERCVLIGYWQSERYFVDYADVIRRDFAFTTPPVGQNAETAAEIAGCNAVCLHFRRGDYVSDPRVAQLHGACGIGYYRAAISHIAATVPDPVFFVFSDDPDWVRASLGLAFPMRVVDHNRDAAVEDMRLMSLCRHHIIANSSFSWWSAWLGAKPGQVVCAPARWFAGYGHDTRDLTPPHWLRIPE